MCHFVHLIVLESLVINYFSAIATLEIHVLNLQEAGKTVVRTWEGEVGVGKNNLQKKSSYSCISKRSNSYSNPLITKLANGSKPLAMSRNLPFTPRIKHQSNINIHTVTLHITKLNYSQKLSSSSNKLFYLIVGIK